jgi:hypothetical protein
MDEAGIVELVVIIGVILIIGFQLEARMQFLRGSGDLHERLDLLEEAVGVVGTVLQRLPELVPQFSINQSPLEGIFDFLKQVYAPEAPTEGSIGALEVRDDNGRFTDGTKEETNKET